MADEKKVRGKKETKKKGGSRPYMRPATGTSHPPRESKNAKPQGERKRRKKGKGSSSAHFSCDLSDRKKAESEGKDPRREEGKKNGGNGCSQRHMFRHVVGKKKKTRKS